MKRKKLLAGCMIGLLSVLVISGCKGKEETDSGVKKFTAFNANPGAEINDDNEIQKMITEKTGVVVKETYLTGQTCEEAVGTMIAAGEYPDFIDGSNGTSQLYDAGALVALDDYLDKYPNIKGLYSEEQWDKLRQDDGHIYWIPQWGSLKGAEKMSVHNDEAFWIQTRVLKWANYPEINTIDEYFQLIEDYNKANPTLEDGTKNIPYTILCDDWRYFCLENPPQFLAGYPNDGCCMVNPETKKVEDYNTSDTAIAYFKKLNEEYKKGIIDPESFTQTYDEYIAKVSSGRVLGMVDQYWNFRNNAVAAIMSSGLDKQGCDYVPLGITIADGIKNQYHTSGNVLNVSAGLAVTVSCKDVEGALQFVNDLLEEDIHTLRFWGVKGVDYEVNDKGEFYRTQAQRDQASDPNYMASHICLYNFFPCYAGTMSDGINCFKPEGQASELYDGLSDTLKECFDAYGHKTFVDFVGTNEAPGPWYPMWSFSNSFTTATEGGVAWQKISEVKHADLPKVVMADDFDKAWNDYMENYNACKPEAFLNELQTELDRRLENAAKYEK